MCRIGAVRRANRIRITTVLTWLRSGWRG
jgi:hypothetical protein